MLRDLPHPARDQQIECVPAGDRVRIRLRGRIDGSLAARVEAECADLLRRGFSDLVLDLRAVTAIDPLGLTAIAAIERRVRRHRGWVTIDAGATRIDALGPAGPVGHLLERPDRRRGMPFFDWSR